MHLLTMANNKDPDVRSSSLGILCNITEMLEKYPQPLATEPK
jgi:hypothetical protein